MARNDHQIQQLINTAARAARDHLLACERLSAAFEERYGATYSDADCDLIIDVVDYQGGHLTLVDADQYMADCGFPKLQPDDDAADNTRGAE